jgi:hypothetical protein
MFGNVARGLGTGVGLGLGLGTIMVITAGSRNDMRPVLRGTMKAGLSVAEFSLGAAARMKETAEDLYHEARAQREVEREARDSQEEEDSAQTVLLPRAN